MVTVRPGQLAPRPKRDPGFAYFTSSGITAVYQQPKAMKPKESYSPLNSSAVITLNLINLVVKRGKFALNV